MCFKIFSYSNEIKKKKKIIPAGIEGTVRLLSKVLSCYQKLFCKYIFIYVIYKNNINEIKC